jgi:hypothetical protein
MKKWLWVCSIEGCDAHGSKGLSHRSALHNGKWHIIRVHGMQHTEPILIESRPNQTPQHKSNEAV